MRLTFMPWDDCANANQSALSAERSRSICMLVEALATLGD